MKRIFYFLFFCLSLSVFAQKPPQSDDVVKITTTLIQLDANVTDKNGKSVTDLNAEDFEVFENGKKQKITNLSYVAASSVQLSDNNPNSKIDAKNKTASLSATTNIRPEQVRRTFALVVDDLNLSFGSVYYVRQSLKKFVNEQMQTGDLVAIIRSSSGTGVLQQFTSDRQLLHAAINKIRWNPVGDSEVESMRAVGTDAQDITERTTDDMNRIAARIGANRTPQMREVSPRVTNITNNSAEFRQSSFAVATLGTINYTINGMRDLPGRKTIMLFSDGIKIFSAEKSSFANSVRLGMQKLIDLANRSSVVIYSVDTKGLGNLGLQASDNTTELRPDQIDRKIAQRENDFYNSQEGLVYLAEQTGGKAYLNNNDLNYGLRRVLEDETGYYLIGYQPDSDAFNSEKLKFNKIEIKVKRPNLKVSYRSGFFNTLPERQKSQDATAQQKITKALTSPFSSNEIGLKLNAAFADDATDGTYIRSLLHIEAKDLKFSTDAEGWQKATFDAVAVAFGSEGVPVEQALKTYTIKVKGETYQAMLDKGFVYTLILPVKKPGVYQLRTVLRDTGSDRIGSAGQFIKVPVLKKEIVTLSNLSLENLTATQWQNRKQGGGNKTGQNDNISTSLYDTTLRQFKHGTYLFYGFEIYNAKLDKSQTPQLTTQMKLLHNGKTLVEGKINPVNAAGQPDLQHIRTTGAIILKNEFETGDYILEVTITDNLSKKTATQWIDFMIVG